MSSSCGTRQFQNRPVKYKPLKAVRCNCGRGVHQAHLLSIPGLVDVPTLILPSFGLFNKNDSQLMDIVGHLASFLSATRELDYDIF